jgi:dCMP deaminase
MFHRPPWTSYFMLLAKLAATRSTCNSRKIGAVIVKDKRVLATGYNGAMPGEPHCLDEASIECENCDGGRSSWLLRNKGKGVCPVCHGTGKLPYCHRRHTAGLGDVSDNYCRASHAEANAIAQAAAQGTSIQGAEVYTTLYPCLPCLKLMSGAGIKGVYYEMGYDTGRYYKSGQVPEHIGNIEHFTQITIDPETMDYILDLMDGETSGRSVNWDGLKG